MAAKPRKKTSTRRITVKRTMTEITCEWCGDAFWAVRSDARFCSDKCRIYAHRQRQRKGNR